MATRTIDLGKVTNKTLVVEITVDAEYADTFHMDKTYKEIFEAALSGSVIFHWPGNLYNYYYTLDKIGDFLVFVNGKDFSAATEDDYPSFVDV